jgi:hypothetical protein
MFDKATGCAEGECAIEDVQDLIHNLEEQKKVIYSRLVEITNMIDTLKKVNAGGEREVDQVRETVRAIARLFLMGVSIWRLFPVLFRLTTFLDR